MPKSERQDVMNECPVCGAESTVKIRHAPFEGKYNQLSIRVEDAESYICDACGEEFFTNEQSKELSRRVKASAREQLGVLSPERIVALRRRLNLSQEELEDLLGLGEKVITRWENGRVIQGKATDYLLRLMERMPSIVQALREIRIETRAGGPVPVDR